MKAPSCPFNEIVTKIKVLTLEVRTALSEEELSERLRRFFGTCGLGLGVKADGPGRLTFEGGEGYVAANFYTDGSRTLLKIVANGWAVQVKQFVTGLP